MDKLLPEILNSPLANLFVVAGLFFLGIGIVGNISGKIQPSIGGRVLSALVGIILIGGGLFMHTDSNPPSTTSEPPTQPPVVEVTTHAPIVVTTVAPPTEEPPTEVPLTEPPITLEPYIPLIPLLISFQTNTPLYGWWSPSREDNFITSDSRWAGQLGNTLPPDYSFVRLEGYVYSPDEPQPSGTIALYSWWSPSRGDNFATSNSSWAGKDGQVNSPDYIFVRLEGYVRQP
ncbi:MAG: hypothetical protein JNK81_13190 [Anaerolineales bacterium]|nr:hypothetical protein [Anaerolineales bacterium]